MAYELNLQNNNKISTTSQDIFVPKQNNNMIITNEPSIFESKQSHKLINKQSHKVNPILLVRLFIQIMFINLLLTSDKYKTIFDTNIKKFYVLTTLFLSYIQIGIVFYLFIKLKKYILKRIKNIFTRSCFIIFVVLFCVYIISTLQLTYILINIDKYKCKDITFLTYYFNLIQIVTIFSSFSYLY